LLIHLTLRASYFGAYSQAASRDMASARRIAAPSLGISCASPGATPSSVLTNGWYGPNNHRKDRPGVPGEKDTDEGANDVTERFPADILQQRDDVRGGENLPNILRET